MIIDNKGNIKALNKLLQGEHMAIESFNVYISKLREGKVKDVFQSVQDTHRENAKTLADYIQDSYGTPKENVGVKGIFSDMKINAELGSVPYETEVIKDAIEGETKGINMAEKVLRGELDDNSRALAGKLLERDRENINKLKILM